MESQRDFEYHIDGKPDYSLLTVQIPSGKTIKVEASAMASMDTNIVMKTKFKGGFSRMFTGESLFINDFTAQNGDGEIKIAPSAPGDLVHQYIDNEMFYIQNSGFVASSPGVNMEMNWQGFKGFFTGEGLFLIRCSGKGDLWFNSYGGIIEIDVKDSYIIDTGHIVAFTSGLNYKVRMLGGYKSFFFSGEGFVCEFTGQGKIWVQTRKVQPFAGWLYPFRPQKNG
jgi:uncharacterized protein (TIGR00266 family)